MKLELKHLSPYLPYKLKVKTKIGNLILCQLNNSTKWNAWFYFCRNSKNKNQLYNFNNLKNADGIGRGFLLKEITPILRPISDIEKEIEVNGEIFIPLEKLESMFGDCTKLTDTMLVGSFVPFGIVQKLFEWHFDVFNLIENDLAIDINTLPQSSE